MRYVPEAKRCPNCGRPNPEYQEPEEINTVEEVDDAASEEQAREQRKRIVDAFITRNYDSFPRQSVEGLRESLLTLGDYELSKLQGLTIYSPFIMLLVSIFLGWVGVDRFLIGHIAQGVGKCACFLLSWLILPGVVLVVWWAVDLFAIGRLTRAYNRELVRRTVHV